MYKTLRLPSRTTTKTLPFEVSEKTKKTSKCKALNFLRAKDNTALTTCFRPLVCYQTASKFKLNVMTLHGYDNYNVDNLLCTIELKAQTESITQWSH